MSQTNETVANLLDEIGELLALKKDSPFRVRAYTEAARSIRAMSEDIDEAYRAGRLRQIPGVGEAIAAKIGEFLDSGHLRYFNELRRQVPAAGTQLLNVPGIGPARAGALYDRLGISTIAELEQAAGAHKLRDLPGFGRAIEDKIVREAARAGRKTGRMLLGVALPAAEEVVRLLRACPAVEEIDAAGSIRRMEETIGDIDILASSDRPSEVVRAFTSLPITREVLKAGPVRAGILTDGDLQIDLRVIKPDEYGSGLQYFTGSKAHSIALRLHVIRRGWKLSEYGLFDEHGQRIAGRTEEEIYRALGMDLMPPELRTNRGEIEAALRHQLPHVVELSDIKGDLHVHTNWSDGHDPPEQIVEAAIARGYDYMAITDRSQSRRVARGLSVERLQEQRRLVERLNERYTPFRVLHGTEVDILPDGGLDYPDEVLAAYDIVSASVDRAFGMSRDRMTERILRAVRNPHVDVLNHPTGRLLLRRPAYEVDLEAVIGAARENGVALEIDGQPERMDLDDTWSRRARDAGVLIACNSDAHSARQLEYMRYAVAVARRGWVEPAGVLNCLPLDDLLRRLHVRSD